MTVFSKLKLVASKKERNVSPVVARRNKLAGKIDEQLLFATAPVSYTHLTLPTSDLV